MSSNFSLVVKIFFLLSICGISLCLRPRNEIVRDAKELALRLSYAVTLKRNETFRKTIYTQLAGHLQKNNAQIVVDNLVNEWAAWEKNPDHAIAETKKLTNDEKAILHAIINDINIHESKNTVAVGYDEYCKEIVIAANLVTSVFKADFSFKSDPLNEFRDVLDEVIYADAGLNEEDMKVMHDELVKINGSTVVNISIYSIMYLKQSYQEIEAQIFGATPDSRERLIGRLYHAEIQIYYYWMKHYDTLNKDNLVIVASKPKCTSCFNFLSHEGYKFQKGERAGSQPGKQVPITRPVNGTQAYQDPVFKLDQKDIKEIYRKNNYYELIESEQKYPDDEDYKALMAYFDNLPPVEVDKDACKKRDHVTAVNGTCKKRAHDQVDK